MKEKETRDKKATSTLSFKSNDKIDTYHNREKSGIAIGSMSLKNDHNPKQRIKTRTHKTREYLKVEYAEWYKSSQILNTLWVSIFNFHLRLSISHV